MSTIAPKPLSKPTGKNRQSNGASGHAPTSPDMNRIYTAEELERFPSDWHYELIYGKLRKNHLPAGRNHGKCTAFLAARLTVFIDDEDLGEVATAETGFKLGTNPDTVKAPDFAFTAKERVPPPQKRGYGVFVPDLVVETRSPDDSKADIQTKIDEWLFFGCRMVLDVDPVRGTLTVHRADTEAVVLSSNDTFDGGDVLPGFTLALGRVFGQGG